MSKDKKIWHFKINWKNFVAFFILMPLLLGVLITYFNVETSNLFSSSFVPDRGENIIPDVKGYAEDLPSGDLVTGFLPAAINIFLSLIGIVITCMIIYSGYLYVTNFGNEEQTTKARDVLMYALMGITIIILSYAIVYGVTHITWGRR